MSCSQRRTSQVRPHTRPHHIRIDTRHRNWVVSILMSGVMLLCTDCFSKFFHRQTRSKFCNEVIIKSVTAPQLCLYTCYLSLWNITFQSRCRCSFSRCWCQSACQNWRLLFWCSSSRIESKPVGLYYCRCCNSCCESCESPVSSWTYSLSFSRQARWSTFLKTWFLQSPRQTCGRRITPHLKSIGYKIWSIMQQRPCQEKCTL